MVPKRLLVLFGLYTLLAAGLTVAPLTYLYGGFAAFVLLFGSLVVLPALHGQAGTSLGTIEGVGVQSSTESGLSMDMSQTDHVPTGMKVSSFLPHKDRSSISFYLLGVLLYSLGALAILLG